MQQVAPIHILVIFELLVYYLILNLLGIYILIIVNLSSLIEINFKYKYKTII